MEKNDEKKPKLDMLPYIPISIDDEDRKFNNFFKVLAGSALSMSVSLIFTGGTFSLIPIILTSVVVIPLTYVGLTKLKDHSDAVFKRDMYEANMICAYLRESVSKEKIIDEFTTSFLNEIDERNFPMSIENQVNLNQLLFLINKSYYEAINEYRTKLTRHSLITKLLDATKLYIDTNYPNGDAIFDIEDAKAVINSCIFIPDKVKYAIIEEFSSARVNAKRPSFMIAPKDNIYAPNFYKSEKYIKSAFDINDIKCYETLKEIFEETDINQFKDAYAVEWDLETLKDCMTLIVRRFNDHFVSEDDELYHYDMVSQFMYHLSAYASLNKVPSVGIREIINTFKNFDRFDFSLRLEIIDAIIEEFNLDMSMHPYRDNPVTKPVGKVISFPTKKSEGK